jgi:hypothetical protein
MKVLTTSLSSQTINIIPRRYTENVVLSLRDDSSNTEVLLNLPTCVINKGYLDITSVFNLKEGHFYDLKVYELSITYDDFKERVISAGGTFEDNNCLLNFVQLVQIEEINDNNIIYLDRIFCTDQTIDQDTNNYYSVNKNEYVSKSGNNDFIIL